MNEWISIKDGLPELDGDYLVVRKVWDFYKYDVVSFSTCLKNVDEYDFCDINGPGFYYYDGEFGYLEHDNVICWMTLPDFPKEELITWNNDL